MDENTLGDQPQTEQKKSSPLSLFFGITAIIILVVVVNGSAYYFGTKRSNAQTPTPALTLQKPLGTTQNTYENPELHIAFTYPAIIGTPTLVSATDSAIGTTSEGENWWQIFFDQRDPVPGNTTISFATRGFAPATWGDMPPQWSTNPVQPTDENTAIEAILQQQGLTVVRIEKVPDNMYTWEAWTLNCGETCFLRHHFIISGFDQFASFQIHTIVATFPNTENTPSVAEQTIQTIAAADMTNPMKQYIQTAATILAKFDPAFNAAPPSPPEAP